MGLIEEWGQLRRAEFADRSIEIIQSEKTERIKDLRSKQTWEQVM